MARAREDAAVVETARAALDRGAWESARAAFEQALAAGPTGELLEGLGAALWWLDRLDESLAVRERSFRLYREAGEARRAARVAWGLAIDSVDVRGDAPAAGWLERARRQLDGLEPGPEHGWLALWEGQFALRAHHDTHLARRRAEQALDAARRLDLLPLESLAQGLVGLVLVAEGEVAEGMRRLDQAAAAALGGDFDDLEAIGVTCCLVAHACERVRDYERARQWADRIDDFRTRWDIGPALTVCRTQHAAMLIGRGDWAKAELELREANRVLAASRPLLLPEGIEQLAELRRRQGRFEEAESLFAQTESRSLATLGRAAIAFDRGDVTLAVDLADRFLRRTPADNWSGRAAGLALLVRARLAAGSRADADQTAASLFVLSARVGTPFVAALARQADGLLAHSDADFERARTHFEDAVDLFGKANAPFEASRARLDLAECLRAAERTQAAATEVRAARAGFEGLGATHEAERAQKMLRTLEREAAPVSAATGRSSSRERKDAATLLTARELEVLRLVATGASDRDVSRRLGLSEHTVHRHVSNIRTKLGLSSRAAATAWAAQHGLL